ncbi:hypothetical protein Droror1_Dr00017313 [Drosera rotundifolia]
MEVLDVYRRVTLQGRHDTLLLIWGDLAGFVLLNSLKLRASEEGNRDEGFPPIQDDEVVEVPIFCNFVSNNTKSDIEAEFLDVEYILRDRAASTCLTWRRYTT